MLETYPLITTIAVSIVLAFVFGYLAKLIRLPSILGYLLAGIIIGPYTPGFVADQEIAKQLAEIGVILLMFGVGLHFSLTDLLSVKKIALPGALFQMLLAAGIGAAFLYSQGSSLTESIVFGFSLSVASTIVLLRALEDRRELDSATGRIAVGWLIVEDIAMVLAIVLLPVLAAPTFDTISSNWIEPLKLIGITLLKITIFAIAMIVFGRRLLPSLLVGVARHRSRELTSLCTLAIALGFAYLAYVAFGASFALGAFLAGMVLNESEIGHKSAEQSLPLRDTFAVLFFVAVGMLFDPLVLIKNPYGVLSVFLIIVLGKSLASLIITTAFKQKTAVSLMIAASLAQIGEFSFIFAGMALSLGLMQQPAYDLVLAGSLLSIAINPLLFALIDKWHKA
jgi:CPA2 family monovalent cation:H+ antiporter-2